MNYTTTNTVANSQIVYLPTPQSYGGIINQPGTWTTTSAWEYQYHPEGRRIIEEINKAYGIMLKYEGLINGVIFKELNKKLSDLVFCASCQWGVGLQGQIWGTPNTWNTVPAITSTTSGTTWGANTIGTANVTTNTWYQIDTNTNLHTTGTTYIY